MSDLTTLSALLVAQNGPGLTLAGAMDLFGVIHRGHVQQVFQRNKQLFSLVHLSGGGHWRFRGLGIDFDAARAAIEAIGGTWPKELDRLISLELMHYARYGR